DDLPEDPDHILVQHNRRNPEVFDVYRIDLRTQQETLVATNPGDYIGWQTDHAGRVRIAVRSVGLDMILLYRPDDASEVKPIITPGSRTAAPPFFFDAADRLVYMSSNRGRDRKALVLVDPALPGTEQVVYENPEVDIAGAEWSRARKRLELASF